MASSKTQNYTFIVYKPSSRESDGCGFDSTLIFKSDLSEREVIEEWAKQIAEPRFHDDKRSELIIIKGASREILHLEDVVDYSGDREFSSLCDKAQAVADVIVATRRLEEERAVRAAQELREKALQELRLAREQDERQEYERLKTKFEGK